jgi:hypothetical protein
MKKITLSFLICMGALRTFGAEALHYVLLPGSTISSVSGGTIGPAEPLSGSFDWVRFDTGSSLIGFDAMKLDFRSASFALELNTTAANDVGTSVFPDSCMTYFEEVLNASGLGLAVGQLNTVGAEVGCYSGPAEKPITLTYSNLSLNPVHGGVSFALLRLFASLDDDRDGVPDISDQCPGTPTGQVVDPQGCSIDQLVPCTGPAAGEAWKNRGEYLSTLLPVIRNFLSAGLITREEARALIRSKATESICGEP